MKTKLLSLIFLALGTNAFSQVVITASDINPSVGDVFYQTSDSLIDQSIVITAPGSGQTWDFTLLNNHNADTLTFINPSSAPAASSFNTATHVFSTLANGNTSYSFLQKSTNNLVALGAVIDNPFNPGTNLVIKIKPSQRIINFPSQVGSGTNTSYFQFRVQVSGSEVGVTQFDSIRVTTSGKRLITPDADGTLTTPEATHNVLRIETISLDTSKIEGKIGFFWAPIQTNYDTTYTYDFWTPGTGFPVVTLGFNYITQEVNSAQWLTNNPLGLRKAFNTSPGSNIYPNPSSGMVKFDLVESGKLTIIDQLGRNVFEGKLNKGINNISLDKLNSGVYQAIIAEEANGKTSIQKLVINK